MVLKSIVKGIAYGGLFLFAVSCRTIKPTAPAESVLPYSVENAPSYISLTLETGIDEIETFINRRFDGLVYEDMDLKNNGGDNLMVKAWKQSRIELGLNGNELRYEVPLKLWIKYYYENKSLGISFSQPIELEGAILLKFKSELSLNPNWTVTSKTTPIGYSWLKSPALKLGPVDIPIGFLADNILKNNQKPIAQAIDKIVAEELNLRQYGLDAWKTLSTPMKINEEYNTWVALQPVELYTIPVSSAKGKIVHQMSVKALAEVFVGQPPHHETTSLPDIKIVEKVEKDFSIMLQTRLSYSEMQTVAGKYIVGKTFQIGNRAVKVTGLEIFPAGDKIALQAEVEGDIKGTIYFTGRPVYDSVTAEIKLDKIDFDIRTRNVLHKTASWLLNGTINRKIGEQLIFPVQKDVEEAKRQINEYLNHTQLTPELTLNGRIVRIGFGEIKILNDGLLIPIELGGNLKVSFKVSEINK
ncbi:MAG TPA: hypothetical protein DEO70_07490 [Bacteroidales bacterium]|nr:MAG: hypothetical protein A2X11_07110 [Bacteroidetes bacterium GWE2_42_24]OFY25927.1 MAG: hypothetical protein A2X09_04485 [Bacteroidetes bacterium GWF2_43_11]HBZ66665.1 hypothetical protein [Bacteroidales bacterium]